jgi:hypothetical protein
LREGKRFRKAPGFTRFKGPNQRGCPFSSRFGVNGKGTTPAWVVLQPESYLRGGNGFRESFPETPRKML